MGERSKAVKAQKEKKGIGHTKMEGRQTARMSTAREAGELILKTRKRELIAENKALRRKLLESQRREMALKDQVIRGVRLAFNQQSPTSPERQDKGTQTGVPPASGSIGRAPAGTSTAGPTPGGSEEAPPTAAGEPELLP